MEKKDTHRVEIYYGEDRCIIINQHDYENLLNYLRVILGTVLDKIFY